MAANWCPAGVPGVNDDVVIPVTAAVVPEVKVPGMSCKNMIIRAGATLTIATSHTLNVSGHVTIEN